MIGYVTLGSNDFDKAKAFYDAVLGELGGKRTLTMGRIQFYGSSARGPMVAICGRRPRSAGGISWPFSSGVGCRSSI